MLEEQQGYVADVVRLEQFTAAVARVVKRGDRIADLGCGTGILGLLCLQAGAANVYAIDATVMIEVARISLSAWGERVQFFHGRSTRIDLPEQVDLVICDQVGYFGFDAGIVRAMDDARRRILKPGGALIPARIRLQIAAVESEECRNLADGWLRPSVPASFRWIHQHAVNSKYAARLRPDELLGTPAELGELELLAANPDYFSWDAELCMARDGILHGLGGWFDCELAEGVWMTNSPLSCRAIDRPQAFLPLREAVAVKAGDMVKAKVMARPADDLIAWEVQLPADGQKFSQSTWQGELLTSWQIVRGNPAHVPRLSREGKARTVVLGQCDGQRTVGQIEQAVLRAHPDLFPSSGEISLFVAQVLGRDSE